MNELLGAYLIGFPFSVRMPPLKRYTCFSFAAFLCAAFDSKGPINPGMVTEMESATCLALMRSVHVPNAEVAFTPLVETVTK